jgi:hypothetical protein
MLPSILVKQLRELIRLHQYEVPYEHTGFRLRRIAKLVYKSPKAARE